MSLTKLDFSILYNSFRDKIFTQMPFIGLDLGMEKLNMIQIDFKLGEPVVTAASSDYLNCSYQQLIQQPKIFKALIKSTFKSAGFKGSRVVATVPAPLLKMMFFSYQCKAAEQESQALLNALTHRVDDLADYVIDYLPINPQLNEQQDRMALVAMVKYDAVENFLDLLAYSGLSVEALEIGPVAIKRLLSALTHVDAPQKILTINFGTHNSYLTVIWNGELLLDREINFGMDSILEAIAKALDIDIKTAFNLLHEFGLSEHEDTQQISGNDDSGMTAVLLDILRPGFFYLSEEIKDVLVYVASETRGGAVELIYLMGSLSRIPEVDQIIDRLISIPVQTINPFFGFSAEEKPGLMTDLGPLSGVAVATGLAMRGHV